MTRQEYDEKDANGTLTVRDIIENEEHASPEMLLKLNSRKTGAALEQLRAIRKFYLLYGDFLSMLQNIPARFVNAKLLDNWDELTNRLPGVANTHVEFYNAIDQLQMLVTQMLELDCDGLPPKEKQRLIDMTEAINEIKDGAVSVVLNAVGIETVNACKTGCPAFSQGTCQYTDKTDCPRIRQMFIEQSNAIA